MKSSKLVTYLCEIGRYEQRIEISREILAHNMNFSPVWLLGRLTREQPKETQNHNLTISHFRTLAELAGFVCEQSDLLFLFQYFSTTQDGLVQGKAFVEAFLPVVKDGLRKAVLKRESCDIDLTQELKYALRRIFSQIIKAKSQLNLYRNQFNPESPQIENPSLRKQQLQAFLSKFSKNPAASELTLVYNFLVQGRTKELPIGHICAIIEDATREIQYFAHRCGYGESQRIRNGKDLSDSNDCNGDSSGGSVYSFVQEKSAEAQKGFSYQTPSNYSVKSKGIIDKKSQSPIFDSIPHFKIPRTSSVIQSQQQYIKPISMIPSELKKAEQLAKQILSTTKQNETPYRHIQSTTPPFPKSDETNRGQHTQQNPKIFYSRRKGSHPETPNNNSQSEMLKQESRISMKGKEHSRMVVI